MTSDYPAIQQFDLLNELYRTGKDEEFLQELNRLRSILGPERIARLAREAILDSRRLLAPQIAKTSEDIGAIFDDDSFVDLFGSVVSADQYHFALQMFIAAIDKGFRPVVLAEAITDAHHNPPSDSPRLVAALLVSCQPEELWEQIRTNLVEYLGQRDADQFDAQRRFLIDFMSQPATEVTVPPTIGPDTLVDIAADFATLPGGPSDLNTANQ